MANKRKRQVSRRKGPGASKHNSKSSSILSGHVASDRAFEARKRALDALAKMRHERLSLQAAAYNAGTTPATVRKYAPAALRKSKSGRWTATKNDSYIRILNIYGPHGQITARGRGYKEGQLASDYLAAVNRWKRNGKASELAPFHGKRVGGVQLFTSIRGLEALRDAGLLSQLDALYAASKDVR